MPKKIDPQRIKGYRTYTVNEAAELMGVCVVTIRNWIKKGMRVLDKHGPTLIRGEDMRTYLRDRQAKARFKLAPDELLCMTCKAGRKPAGMMVDYTPYAGKTGRISGLCDTCGGSCNRMVDVAKLPALRQTFDVAISGMPDDKGTPSHTIGSSTFPEPA